MEIGFETVQRIQRGPCPIRPDTLGTPQAGHLLSREFHRLHHIPSKDTGSNPGSSHHPPSQLCSTMSAHSEGLLFCLFLQHMPGVLTFGVTAFGLCILHVSTKAYEFLRLDLHTLSYLPPSCPGCSKGLGKEVCVYKKYIDIHTCM